MTSHTGFVMTLANSIIGVSLLAMPYCFKQCGLVLAVLLLLASNITTRLACHYLVKSAVMCRRKSFEYVAYHAFGGSGKLLVELGVIGFMLGTSVAFFVVMGDLAPTIVAKLLEIENSEDLRTYVLIVVGMLVVFPLSLLRNIESLAAISTVTMLFYFLLVFKVMTESFPHLAAATWPSRVNYWRPEGVLQCFPIFAMALSCQTQVYEILEVLPNATTERMNDVVRAAVSLCTCLYVAVGFFGYIAYARENFGGNVLLSFSPSTMSDLFQLGFVVSIALSFPIVVFPCRASLNSLLFKKGAQYHELSTQSTYIPDGRFKILTVAIVGVSLCTGLLIPSIEFVLGFVGSTIGVATCVIFPAAAFINISNKATTERLVAKTMLVLGIFVMVLGMYGNLDAAGDRRVELPLAPVDSIKPVGEEPSIKKTGAEAVNPILSKEEPIPLKANPPDERKEPPVPIQQSQEQEVVPPKVIVEKVPVVPAKPLQIEEKKESSPPEKKDAPIVVIAEERREPPLPGEPPAPPPKVIEEKKAPLEQSIVPKEEMRQLPNTSNEKLDNFKIPDLPEIKAISSTSQPIVVPLLEEKKVEPIHEDAIAREELQLKEDDTQEKTAVEKKQKELLQTLKEHQEEQKKLLVEQKNILNEIKILDGGKAEPEPIQPEKFNDNIDKIQEVIDELKERKQEMDKTNGEKIAEDKKKNLVKKEKMAAVLAAPKVQKDIVPPILNKSGLSAILPIIPIAKKVEPNSVGRDILTVDAAHSGEREKREAIEDEESCKKDDKKNENLEVQKESMDSGIKETERLSAPVVGLLKNEGDLLKVSERKMTDFLKTRDETLRKRK